MERANNYGSFIKRIATTGNAALRQRLLKSSNREIICAICDILLNIYSRKLSISKESINKLKRKSAVILKLISKTIDQAKRKELLVKNSEIVSYLQDVFK